MVAKRKWLAAVKRVEQFIAGFDVAKNGEVSVYTWERDEASLGVRVAEVSFFWPAPGSTKEAPLGGGSSFMQVDVPHGAAVCLCAERLAIAYLEEWPAEEIAEEEWRLKFAITGKG